VGSNGDRLSVSLLSMSFISMSIFSEHASPESNHKILAMQF
jgi:hypothetical protein